MPEPFLYDRLDSVSSMNMLNRELPEHLKTSLNPKFGLRPYQVEAFARFLHCVRNDYPGKEWPLYFAFNMATGRTQRLIGVPFYNAADENSFRENLFQEL